jgi:hypothetical protein
MEKPQTSTWLNIVILITLFSIIFLCCYNISVHVNLLENDYDIGIQKSISVFMVILNCLLIIILFVIMYFIAKNQYTFLLSLLPDDSLIPENVVRPNGMRTQIFLWILSTLILIVTFLNAIQYSKIISSDETSSANAGTVYTIFQWVIFVIALAYWIYTSFKTLVPSNKWDKFKQAVKLAATTNVDIKSKDTKKTTISDRVKNKINDVKVIDLGFNIPNYPKNQYIQN